MIFLLFILQALFCAPGWFVVYSGDALGNDGLVCLILEVVVVCHGRLGMMLSEGLSRLDNDDSLLDINEC